MKIKFPKHRSDSLCDTPEQLIQLMSNIRYTEFDKLMSPLEVLLTTHGSCHDQVMLELQELYDMGYDAKAKFIMAVDENGQGLETHSFVYYGDNNKWYWFENAWEDMQGIYKFDGYHDMLDTIMEDFAHHIDYEYSKLYLADFDPKDHTIGEDLDTLVDICMNSAEEYQL